MGYGQAGMAPPRPRYTPNTQVPGMIPPGPYGQPQVYGNVSNYRGAPRPQNGGPGQPSVGGRQAGPQPGQPQRGGGPPSSNRPQNSKGPQQRNGNAPTPAPPIGHPPDLAPFNPTTLASAPPMEQKQMLGEILYMRIAPSQPDLAGKITGMLLEMDNSELLGLLDSPENLGSKVQEALSVLQEFAQKESTKQEQPPQ